MEHVPRAMKAFGAAILVVGLLTVVALAARGSHPGGDGRIAQRHVPAQVNNDLLTIFVLLFAIGAIGLVVAFILYKSEWQAVESHWLRNLILTIVMLAFVTVIAYRLFDSRTVHQRAQQIAQQRAARGEGQGQPAAPPNLRRVTSGGAHFDGTLALGLIGLLLLGGAIYYIRRSSPPPVLSPEPEADVKTAIAAVVSEAIEDLRNEPDARRAVIAAYARMERALARHGVPRHPSETPFEYLARILRELEVRSSAVEELTDLFEYAKFSTHAVDEPMKERAIVALLAVRDDLHEPAVAA